MATVQSVDFTDPHAWDDSALVDSWNEALAEYKKYHSIHARGEKVKDVIKDFEKRQVEAISDHPQDGVGSLAQTHVELGTVDPVVSIEKNEVSGDRPETGQRSVEASTTGAAVTAPTATAAHGTSGIPQALLATVQDEALKNLMMSWYYAGYYTGLIEGQRQSQQATADETSGT